MMKGPDEIEINRSGPMFIVNGGNYVETIDRLTGRLFDDAEICQ